MTRSSAALALFLLLTFATARAEDYPASITLPVSALPAPQNASKAFSAPLPIDDRSVRVALCGVEAYGKNTDLDAGLIDRNVSDPAHAAGGDTDTPKDQGSNARDYHSAITLGVTLGYHF